MKIKKLQYGTSISVKLWIGRFGLWLTIAVSS